MSSLTSIFNSNSRGVVRLDCKAMLHAIGIVEVDGREIVPEAQHKEFSRRAIAAQNAIRKCLKRGAVCDAAQIEEARAAVLAFADLSAEIEALLEVLFFTRAGVLRLGHLVQMAEHVEPDEVSDSEKAELKRLLGRTAEELDASLKNLLDDPDDECVDRKDGNDAAPD